MMDNKDAVLLHAQEVTIKLFRDLGVFYTQHGVVELCLVITIEDEWGVVMDMRNSQEYLTIGPVDILSAIWILNECVNTV